MLVALLLCSVVTGCASLGAVPPKLQSIKTIGIIASVGDQLTLTKAGLTGVTDIEQSFPIDSWAIDDLIISRAGTLLSKRYQIQPVTYRRAAFAIVPGSSPLNLLKKDPVKELIRTEAAPQGLDAYLVITKATSAYGARGRNVAGLGIISHKSVLDSYTQIHALYMIRLVAGNDFDMLDKRSALAPGNIEMRRLAGPSQLVDDSFLPGASGADGNQKLRAGITELIERSLPATLKSMGLTDEP